MLKDTELRSLKPRTKPYKVSDRLGLYVQVSQIGRRAFLIEI